MIGLNSYQVTEEGVKLSCRICSETFTLPVSQAQLDAWNDGALIQRAMPHLTEAQRELFLSGYCGKCFDGIFAEDENEDEDEA